jgi:DNA repair exonuclease SbcCD ATPase subunit
MCGQLRFAVVIFLSLCCGFLSGCDHSSALSDVQQAQADHAHSLGKAWDEIKALKADTSDAEPFEHAMTFAQNRFLKCDHRLTEIESTLARIDEQEDRLTTLETKFAAIESKQKQLTAEFGTADAMFKAVMEVKTNNEKTTAEIRQVLEQQNAAIELLAARKPEPLPAPVAKPSPPHVEIIPADSRIISVSPASCPNSKCCPH